MLAAFFVVFFFLPLLARFLVEEEEDARLFFPFVDVDRFLFVVVERPLILPLCVLDVDARLGERMNICALSDVKNDWALGEHTR